MYKLTNNDLWYLNNMTIIFDNPIYIYNNKGEILKKFLGNSLDCPPTNLVKKLPYFGEWELNTQPDINFYAIHDSGLIGGFAIKKLRIIIYARITSDKKQVSFNSFAAVNAKKFRSQLSIMFYHFFNRQPVLLPDQDTNLNDLKIISDNYVRKNYFESKNRLIYLEVIMQSILCSLNERDSVKFEKEFQLLENEYSKINNFNWINLHKKEWIISYVSIFFYIAGKKCVDNLVLHNMQENVLDNIRNKREIGNPVTYLYSIGLLLMEQIKLQQKQQPFLVRKVDTELTNNISNNILLSEIADNLNISESYLTKIYKKYTGQTIHEKYLKLKINMAKQQLLYTNASIENVANSLGFSSYNQFSKVFKRLTGESPKHWQKIRRIVF